ncbi:hypothetical protein I5R65_19165 [Herbaspirillum sp. AP02]|uniref:hypothetical protein n=1 Tax=unclassified Herbaspirillum TaxID=2624150 RepID=UPI0018CAE76D|nr:hypothetical protein [Herbaspirillum sp. AP02]MBG7621595.1 hypothetical protein [Herbaspirillum sp. AP02]
MSAPKRQDRMVSLRFLDVSDCLVVVQAWCLAAFLCSGSGRMFVLDACPSSFIHEQMKATGNVV